MQQCSLLIVTVHWAPKSNYLYIWSAKEHRGYNTIWLTVTVDWALKASYLSGQWKNTDGTFLTVLVSTVARSFVAFLTSRTDRLTVLIDSRHSASDHGPIKETQLGNLT